MLNVPKNIYSACHVRLFGDERRARRLIGYGKKFLYKLAMEMSFNNLQVLARNYKLTDGSTIQVAMHNGIAQIMLYAPPLPSGKVTKTGTKLVEHCYIIVRIKGISLNIVDGEPGVDEIQPAFPGIPIKDMAIVYDIATKEIIVEPDDYDSDIIQGYLEKFDEARKMPLWNAQICGQIDTDYWGEMAGFWRFVATDLGWELYGATLRGVGTAPEVYETVPGLFTTDEDTVGEWSYKATHTRTSEAWVGYTGTDGLPPTPFKAPLGGRMIPVNLRLDYLGNFRDEWRPGTAFDTSFQVIVESGSYSSGVAGKSNMEITDLTTYTMKTTIGVMGKYTIESGSKKQISLVNWYQSEPDFEFIAQNDVLPSSGYDEIRCNEKDGLDYWHIPMGYTGVNIPAQEGYALLWPPCYRRDMNYNWIRRPNPTTNTEGDIILYTDGNTYNADNTLFQNGSLIPFDTPNSPYELPWNVRSNIDLGIKIYRHFNPIVRLPEPFATTYPLAIPGSYEDVFTMYYWEARQFGYYTANSEIITDYREPYPVEITFAKQFANPGVRWGSNQGGEPITLMGGIHWYDDKENPWGSRVMTQIYLSQARKKLMVDVQAATMEDKREIHGDKQYPAFPAIAGSTGMPYNAWPIYDKTYTTYIPSNGYLTAPATPPDEGMNYLNIDVNFDEITEVEEYITEAEELGMCVLAASDLYPNASNADPRLQVADPTLTYWVTALWLAVYPKSYMEAVSNYDEDTWEGKLKGRCPQFVSEIHHLKPFMVEVPGEEV